MENIVVTPTCPICLKNYDATTIPKICYPCGHGMCGQCIISYREHEESEDITCPLCRGVVVEDFENYDLQHITNEVNINMMPYWSRRLLEAVNKRGGTINIDEQLLPFCKTIFTRIIYKDDYKILARTDEDVWTKTDIEKVEHLTRAFIKALVQSKIEVDEALNWIHVLNIPSNIENHVIKDVNRYYTARGFLKRMNALWLMDPLFE